MKRMTGGKTKTHCHLLNDSIFQFMSKEKLDFNLDLVRKEGKTELGAKVSQGKENTENKVMSCSLFKCLVISK